MISSQRKCDPSLCGKMSNLVFNLFSLNYSLDIRMTQRLCDEDLEVYQTIEGIVHTGVVDSVWVDQLSGMVKFSKDGKVETVHSKEDLKGLIGNAQEEVIEEEEVDEDNI